MSTPNTPTLRTLDPAELEIVLDDDGGVKYAFLFNEDVAVFLIHRGQERPIGELIDAIANGDKIPADGMLAKAIDYRVDVAVASKDSKTLKRMALQGLIPNEKLREVEEVLSKAAESRFERFIASTNALFEKFEEHLYEISEIVFADDGEGLPKAKEYIRSFSNSRIEHSFEHQAECEEIFRLASQYYEEGDIHHVDYSAIDGYYLQYDRGAGLQPGEPEAGPLVEYFDTKEELYEHLGILGDVENHAAFAQSASLRRDRRA